MTQAGLGLQRVRLGDLDVAYRALGTGPGLPVVLVHGNGEDSNSWKDQQRALAKARQIYAVDVRGHGASSIGEADGTLDQLAANLVGFLTEIIGPGICVGFSLGRTVVLAAAARSRLVRQAVVIAPRASSPRS